MNLRVMFQILAVIWTIGSCSNDPLQPRSFLKRLGEGDQYLGWSLNYLDSWKINQQPRYLYLAEEHSKSAISTFTMLESDTSPRINEFYVVRERRIRSCRLHAEVNFEAQKNGFRIAEPTPSGCFH